MWTILRTVVLLAVILGPLSMSDAHARRSRSNPYRSFNLHGLNYGSMRWEKSHRSSSSTSFTSRRGFFRR